MNPVKPEKGDEVADYIPGVSPTRLSDLPTVIHHHDQKKMLDTFLNAVSSSVPRAQYLLFSSIAELEPAAISAIKKSLPIPVYPIAFAISQTESRGHRLPPPPSPSSDSEYCLKWLDAQPKASVMYVSMGTESPISASQMKEIAAGMRDSGVRFLLVARRGGGETDLGGNDERSHGVVVGWCDQKRVLSHEAVGGFWTHCGWNSVLECISAGVPMLTFPTVMDQVPNSKLVVEDWGIGVRVTGTAGAAGAPGEVVTVRKEEVAAAVWRFMDEENEERKGISRRVTAMKEACERAIAGGGSSDANLGCFVRDIYANHAAFVRTA